MKHIFAYSLVLSICLFMHLSVSVQIVQAVNLPAGFITLSEAHMTWTDAKVWCQQQGGRLPRINNSNELAFYEIEDGTFIDNFGNTGRPWVEVGLPADRYWTGTEQPYCEFPCFWYVYFSTSDGTSSIEHTGHDSERRVVCVQ